MEVREFLGSVAAWLLGCLAAWLPGFLAAWLPGCLAAWLPGCLAAWLPGCLAAWQSARPRELVGPSGPCHVVVPRNARGAPGQPILRAVSFPKLNLENGFGPWEV